MADDTERVVGQIGPVGALLLWWLLASLVGAVMSLAMHFCMQATINRDLLPVLGAPAGGILASGVIGVLQLTVLWSYLPDRAERQWTSATAGGLRLASLALFGVGLSLASMVYSIGAFAGFSSPAQVGSSIDPTFVIVAVEIAIGVSAAIAVGYSQGEMLQGNWEASAWRAWRRVGTITSTLAAASSVLVLFVVGAGALRMK